MSVTCSNNHEVGMILIVNVLAHQHQQSLKCQHVFFGINFSYFFKSVPLAFSRSVLATSALNKVV